MSSSSLNRDGIGGKSSKPTIRLLGKTMARPLRIELTGVLYHATSHGDRHEDIFLGDGDRYLWLEIFGDVCQRFNWT